MTDKQPLALQYADEIDRDEQFHLEEAATELRRLHAVNQGLVDALHWLIDNLDDGGHFHGHCHEIPGIWDDDNGDLAGKPCMECARWTEIKALAAAGEQP